MRSSYLALECTDKKEPYIEIHGRNTETTRNTRIYGRCYLCLQWAPLIARLLLCSAECKNDTGDTEQDFDTTTSRTIWELTWRMKRPDVRTMPLRCFIWAKVLP